jgi:integral membrane protein
LHINLSFFKRIESIKLFTEKEAWYLFKFTAIGEAFGWTFLLYGIGSKRYKLPGYKFALPVGGSIHGFLFLAYLGIVISAYSSLDWSRAKGFLAILVSVVPYGSLVFEQYASAKRHETQKQLYRRIFVRAIITNKAYLLAIQPINTVSWKLPGGEVGLNETAEQAIARIILEVTNIKASVGRLAYVCHLRDSLELYFIINNSKDFESLDTRKVKDKNMLIDEVRFLKPGDMGDLEPIFLRTAQFKNLSDHSEYPMFFFDSTKYR